MPDFEEPLRLHNRLEFWPAPAGGTAPTGKAFLVFDGTTLKASVAGAAGGNLALAEIANLEGLTAAAAELNKLDGITGYPLQTAEVSFTETGGAGTYTGTVSLPAGATLVDIIVHAVAVWDNDGAVTMIVGDTDPDGFYTAVDLKATDLAAGESLSFAQSGGQAGAYNVGTDTHWTNRYSATARDIIGVVTTASTGGSTGRTRMTVVYSAPVAVSAAVFAAA